MGDFSISRRSLLTLAGVGLLGASVAGSAPTSSGNRPTSGGENTMTGTRRLGAEWESHELTIMSWPTARIWGEDLPYVREDIANLAATIAEFEAVILMASPGDEKDAEYQAGKNVEVITMPVDDLWARDTVPVFVEGADGVTGVDFNFNGWGDKQEHANDALVGAALLEELGIPRLKANLVAEGGSLETDGLGTLFVTESSIVNDNRNAGLSRDEIEARLMELLGMKKVIWFDGVYGEDITDAHIDSLVRFVAPGVANGAVFVPEFGDKAADREAQDILAEQFPDREIVPVAIDTIASGGGGIHCATHDLPGTPED